IFQAYDREKGGFMEYLEDHGVFQTLPHALMLETFRAHYPHLYESGDNEAKALNLLALDT
ncbi:MAG: transglutaminase, partial [Bacteroidota bacterium]